MSRHFRGQFEGKFDAKGRISVPARFRRVLEALDPNFESGRNPELAIVFGWPDRKCLEIYSVKAMDEMADEVMRMPARSERRETMTRMLGSHSQDFSLDENGRLLIPKPLLAHAGLSGEAGEEALFAGMLDKFELWQPEAYRRDTTGKFDWYDEHGNPDAPLEDMNAQTGSGANNPGSAGR